MITEKRYEVITPKQTTISTQLSNSAQLQPTKHSLKSSVPRTQLTKGYGSNLKSNKTAISDLLATWRVQKHIAKEI